MKIYKKHKHDYQFNVDAHISGKNEKLNITVNSDLMKQYSPGTHPQPSVRKNLRAIKDVDGFPIVFFLNEKNKLKMAYKLPTFEQGKAEWNMPTISDKLFEDHFPRRNDLSITTFEIGQTKAGHFKLLLEIYEHEQDKSHLLTTNSISNKIDENFLENIRNFESRGALLGKAQRILVGTAPLKLSNGKEYAPLEVLSLLHKGDLSHYFWKPDGLGGEQAKWRAFTLATAANNLKAMTPMQNIDGYGVYALVERGGIETLSLNVLVDVDGGMHTIRQELVQPPGGVKVMDSALSNDDAHTDLYLGGQGLWVHKAERTEKTIAENSKPIRLTKDKELQGIQQLATVTNHQQVTALAVDSKGVLFRLMRDLNTEKLKTYLNDPDYLSPVPIHNKLKEFHPVSGWNGHAESLILVDEENKIRRFEHSPSGWHEKNIPIPSHKKEINEVSSYTTQVNIHRKDGQAFNSEKNTEFIRPSFTLRCDEPIEALVNGKHKRLIPNKDTLVYPDLHGKITIVNQTETLGIPHLSLGSPYFNEKLKLNPAQKFERKLHSYKSKEELEKDLVDQHSGKSLIPESHRGNLGPVFNATQEVKKIDLKMKLDRGELIEFAGDIKPMKTWRLSIVDGKASYLEGDVALTQPDGTWFWDALKSLASDALQWAKKAIGNAVHFIVKQVEGFWQIAVKIGEAAFRFVVKTAAQIFQVFKMILKKGLGIDLDAIFKWLGFLFNWKDIVTTYSIYSNLAFQSFKQGEHKVQTLKGQALQLIDSTHNWITNAISELDEHRELKFKIDDNKNNGRQHETDEAKKAESMVRTSPGGNFAFFQLQNGALVKQNPQSGLLITPTLSLNLDTFLAEIKQSMIEKDINWEKLFEKLKTWIEGVITDINGIINEVVKLVQGKTANPNALFKLIKDVLDKFANGGKALVSVLFDIVGEIFKAFEELLFTEIIPNSYISGLFDLLIQAGGGASLPARSKRLNIANFFILVMAIPTTVMFKMVTNRVPFPERGGMDRLERVALFKAIEGGTMPMRVYKDMSHIKGITNGVLNVLESPLTAVSSLAGGSIPPYLNLPIDLVRIGCNIPYGSPTVAKYGGWLLSAWLPLGTNIYSILSPGPSGKVSSGLKIVIKFVALGYKAYVFTDSLLLIAHPDFKDKEHIPQHILNTTWKLFSTTTSTMGGSTLSAAAFDDEPESKAVLMIVGVGMNAISDISGLCRAGTIAALDLAPLDILR